jgi:hypothetical protein
MKRLSRVAAVRPNGMAEGEKIHLTAFQIVSCFPRFAGNPHKQWLFRSPGRLSKSLLNPG